MNVERSKGLSSAPLASGQLNRGEEIETSKDWADRSGNALIGRLIQINGRWCFDIRRHFSTTEGKLAPTRKGLTIGIRKLAVLRKAIEKAEREARVRGFLDQAGGAGE